MLKTKHYFIINPKAGKSDVSKVVAYEIENAFKGSIDEYSIYITKERNDAEEYTKFICNKEKNENIRFYACGGDGTLNEVINGVVGFDNASVSVIPHGTGNDFINNFEESIGFYDIKKQISFESQKIDLIKINDTYAVNLCNIGFDAMVAENMNKFKKLPLINGQGAYTLSIFYSLFHKMTSNLEIKIDDREIIKGEFLLCVAANGLTYGGGYKGAPLAEINDGFIDLCIIKKVSRLKLIKLISVYKVGEHLNNEELKDYFIYKRCKTINIKSNDKFSTCIDGEIFEETNINISVVENAVEFLSPTKL
ncbi:MAG: diacylglycerol kinase family lipid kinase [Clostridium sp.]|uniref:diacylglycerol/lipid kinase family protein n=1 Tax=Clostridium sp. TaxID=1506 RepID=UPI002914E7EF|nr:diacylglycerol kinase family lipid kinase [Clostridium sp.]MDU5111335.1 diacylglycerol kinase family lipid kinase [Clostridium sp.]